MLHTRILARILAFTLLATAAVAAQTAIQLDQIQAPAATGVRRAHRGRGRETGMGYAWAGA